MLELCGMQSTPSLLSLPGSLWPGVVTPDGVLSLSQIELNCVLMLNCIVWNRRVFDIETVYLCYIVIYTFMQHHNDKDARRKTQEDFFNNIFTSHFIARVVQGLHVRGSWRPNINFIFWPHCYDRHVVFFLFSWFWGPLHRSFRGPPRSGVALPTTSGL